MSVSKINLPILDGSDANNQWDVFHSKGAGIVSRIWGSSVCRCVGAAGAALGLRRFVESYSPTAYRITVLACSLLYIYSYRKQLFYEATLAYPVLRSTLDSSWKWYDEIIPPSEDEGGVFLGALPLKNCNHHQTLQSFAVLSLVCDIEFFTKTPWSDPVTPKDWKALGVDHCHIPTEDLQPVSLENLWKAVHWIAEKTAKKINVYVHCKAGRSRSATVVIAYILYRLKQEEKLQKDSAKAAISLVRAIRPRIILFATDKEAIGDFYRSLL